MAAPMNLEKVGRFYYFRKQIEGKTVKVSLKTTDKVVAAKRARMLAEEERTKLWEKVMGLASHKPYAAIGEIIRQYQDLAIGAVDAGTARNTISALRLVIRRGLGRDEMKEDQVDAESTAVLTGKLVESFEAFYVRRAAGDQVKEESAKRSVQSYLRQARAVFKPKRLKAYERAGLVLPDLQEFLEEETESPARQVKLPPSDALLAKTFEQAKIFRKLDPPGYIAWLLAVCSLRRGEIGVMEWSWLTRRSDVPGILVPAAVAKSKVDRFVPIDSFVEQELNEWRRNPENPANRETPPTEFVLPHVRNVSRQEVRLRASNIFKRVNAWMRGLGWETNHTLHEMRAYYLRQADQQHGIEVAQGLAGHADRRTTENNYIGQRHVGTVQVKLPDLEKALR